MTVTPPGNITLYWNDDLAGELLRFLRGRVNCPEAAADLTHETYVRLRLVTDKSPPDNARAMAFCIAVNLAIDYQRRCNIRNRHIATIDSGLLADIPATTVTEPLQILLSRERFARVESVLSELSPECRRVFWLNKVEGLSYRETGERMGLTVRQVGRLLEQALNHCLQRLGD